MAKSSPKAGAGSQGGFFMTTKQLRVQVNELENAAKKLQTHIGGHVRSLKKIIRQGACVPADRPRKGKRPHG